MVWHTESIYFAIQFHVINNSERGVRFADVIGERVGCAVHDVRSGRTASGS